MARGHSSKQTVILQSVSAVSAFLQSAHEVILQYEQFKDVFGLTSADKKSVDARKQRLARKLDATV